MKTKKIIIKTKVENHRKATLSIFEINSKYHYNTLLNIEDLIQLREELNIAIYKMYEKEEINEKIINENRRITNRNSRRRKGEEGK